MGTWGSQHRHIDKLYEVDKITKSYYFVLE